MSASETAAFYVQRRCNMLSLKEWHARRGLAAAARHSLMGDCSLAGTMNGLLLCMVRAVTPTLPAIGSDLMTDS
jgi:hypothetical protein